MYLLFGDSVLTQLLHTGKVDRDDPEHACLQARLASPLLAPRRTHLAGERLLTHRKALSRTIAPSLELRRYCAAHTLLHTHYMCIFGIVFKEG